MKACGVVDTYDLMKQSLVIISFFLQGCYSLGLIELDNSPTRVHPLPVKAAIKDSSVSVSIPLKVQKKPTGGFRSIVDLNFDVRLSELDGFDVPVVPNGVVVGPKIRW